MKRRIRLKKLKREILDAFDKNQFRFVMHKIDGTHITNENIDEYPKIKEHMRKNLTRLWSKKKLFTVKQSIAKLKDLLESKED